VRVRWLAVLGTLVVLAAFVAEGHSRSSLVVAVSDVGHLLAGAVWLGGLAGCVVALRRLEPAEAGRVLTRFSVLAGGATALVAVSGTVMGARVLGSWEALTGTAYGRLLLLKASAVLVVVALAAVNRFRLLPALTTTATPRAAELLRRTVRAEAAVLLLALGVTGVLVQASPEPAAAAPGGTSTSRDGITVRVSVSPATVGPNEVTVEVSGPDGPVDVAAPPRVVLFGAGLELGQGGATPTGTGAFRATQVVPVAGAWEARLVVEVAPGDQRIVSVPVEVVPG
jgi:copper transport protein